MKASILLCLEELVISKFGKDKWEKIKEMSGIEKKNIFFVAANIDDNTAMKMMKSTCDVLKMTFPQVADAFGEHWVNKYAPKVYPLYFEGAHDAKEFLKKMDAVHESVTKNIKDAHPPRFKYEWENDKVLLMTYESTRGLLDLLIGLVKGVGIYYGENLKVNKISGNEIKITFEK